MNSVVSTNPFDDLETDEETSRISRSTLTVAEGYPQKRHRKKRKAPLPPVSTSKLIHNDVLN